MTEPIKLKNAVMWKQQVEGNLDSYGKVIISAARDVMLALDEGHDCPMASKKLYGHGLSGFQATCIASIIHQCHERGEEFKTFWNEQYGVKERKFAVNPDTLKKDDE